MPNKFSTLTTTEKALDVTAVVRFYKILEITQQECYINLLHVAATVQAVKFLKCQ